MGSESAGDDPGGWRVATRRQATIGILSTQDGRSHGAERCLRLEMSTSSRAAALLNSGQRRRTTSPTFAFSRTATPTLRQCVPCMPGISDWTAASTNHGDGLSTDCASTMVVGDSWIIRCRWLAIAASATRERPLSLGPLARSRASRRTPELVAAELLARSGDVDVLVLEHREAVRSRTGGFLAVIQLFDQFTALRTAGLEPMCQQRGSNGLALLGVDRRGHVDG